MADRISVEPGPDPPPPAVEGKPRRRPVSHACDRCRRRKAKCDYNSAAATCVLCRDNNTRCTFDLPLARRGPKAKKKPSESSSLSVYPDAALLSLPPLSLTSPVPQPHAAGNVSVNAGAANFTSPSASSAASTSWQPLRTPNLEQQASFSLPAVRDFPPPYHYASPSDGAGGAFPISALTRWRTLSKGIALRNKSIEQIVNRCFDLFFDYLYPLTPLVHEPSLREGLRFFLGHINPSGPDFDGLRSNSISNSASDPSWPRHTRDILSTSPGEEPSKSWTDATFTIITALCAEAAFLLPKDLFPEGESVADLFLQASRDCLSHYLEADLETPTANSICIRYFHSNCVHAAGKPKYSWHIFGEATRLAQVMRLHEESSYEGLHPIEAELRRRAFWIVYMGDKSAAILNNRPITIHKYSFESGITAGYPTGLEGRSPTAAANGIVRVQKSGTPQQQQQQQLHHPHLHHPSFIEGFNANLRLWQAASDLLLEIRLFQDQQTLGTSAETQSSTDFLMTDEKRQRLDNLYVIFITCLDNLPPYLQSYTFASIASPAVSTTLSNQFSIQCANLQVSFHCLRMVVTQKFEDIAYYPPGAEQSDLRKTEIVRDILRAMHEAPFWSLQINGEPYVEKIRLCGASLLAVIHRNPTSPLGTRARNDFSVLLDILTRLDSKASDALRSDSTLAL